MTASVKIEFARLQDKTRRGQPYFHVHGYLKLDIGGRAVPHMGYRGAEDVCFNAWIAVLAGIRKTVQQRLPFYRFDEAEQGQPAFLFAVRPGSRSALSIVRSESGEGADDPGWQQVVFGYADFKAAFFEFKTCFLAEIARLAPHQLEYWTTQFDG